MSVKGSSWAPQKSVAAVAQANVYREAAGVSLLGSHPSLEWAAQAHADYFAVNFGDQGPEVYGPHGEASDRPGYSGQWPADRVRAAGYPWFGGSEIMHFLADPVASVDGWTSAIYHRVLLLDPRARYAGYGSARSTEVAVDVMDFGDGPQDGDAWREAPYPLAYPADGQTNVPARWEGGESPDPLPAGAARPVGYPFTLQGVGGDLRVEWAELLDSQGQAVATHPSPEACSAFNCYALIPLEPLRAGVTYAVEARGLVGEAPFEGTWRFTTERAAEPYVAP